jgi:excisionase family DNA binding protein
MTNLLTRAEVAQRLRVCTRSLDRYIQDGTGPRVIHIGGRIRFDEKDVADWLENCRADAA